MSTATVKKSKIEVLELGREYSTFSVFGEAAVWQGIITNLINKLAEKTFSTRFTLVPNETTKEVIIYNKHWNREKFNTFEFVVLENSTNEKAMFSLYINKELELAQQYGGYLKLTKAGTSSIKLTSNYLSNFYNIICAKFNIIAENKNSAERRKTEKELIHSFIPDFTAIIQKHFGSTIRIDPSHNNYKVLPFAATGNKDSWNEQTFDLVFNFKNGKLFLEKNSIRFSLYITETPVSGQDTFLEIYKKKISQLLYLEQASKEINEFLLTK